MLFVLHYSPFVNSHLRLRLGAMATKVSAEQLDAAAMSQFFQFLQCQLRLEAEEKLKQEVWLEDKDIRVTCLQTIYAKMDPNGLTDEILGCLCCGMGQSS